MKARFEFQSDESYSDYLRAYFAAMAMQGICAGMKNDELIGNRTCDSVGLIALALTYADELLKALES